ncbi:polyprotein [Arachis hypogaea]|nr:polyprotein [Arachis hypogaea]
MKKQLTETEIQVCTFEVKFASNVDENASSGGSNVLSTRYYYTLLESPECLLSIAFGSASIGALQLELYFVEVPYMLGKLLIPTFQCFLNHLIWSSVAQVILVGSIPLQAVVVCGANVSLQVRGLTLAQTRLSIRGSSSSSSSTSLPNSPSNPLTEKVTRHEELSPKHNIFEEEVFFKDINQAIDNWEIPKIPQDELYIPDDKKRKSDYIIKTAENNIPLGPDSGEEFHLLTKQSVREHAHHYKYLHIGCVQVAVKPLIREGLNASILMCLRDIRHNDFQDSLIGTVETSLGHGPVYFNFFPNKTVSFLDINILDSLFLNIRIHGLNMKEGSIPAALIYWIQYKVMNTCNSRDLVKSIDRETTLFVTDMTKTNVTVPRLIKWDETDLPQSWSIDRAIPTQPRQAHLLRETKQDESGRVDIFFDRQNCFSSRSEVGTSNDFASARRSFSVTSQSQFSKNSRPINILGLQNNSNISQPFYQTDDDVELQSCIQSPTYSSMNDAHE